MQTAAGRHRVSFSRRLAAFALLTCPRDYRREYGEQILADLDEIPQSGIRTTFEILESAVSMHLDSLARDVHFAMRRLRNSPLFVAIVVLTFALGIGANVAVFSVLNAVLLKPLPYAHPDRLVAVTIYDGRMKSDGGALSVPDLGDLRSQVTLLSDLGVETPSEGTIGGDGKPHTIQGLDVTPPYLHALGMRAQLGRLLNASDERKGVRSIVISDALWHERFDGSPAIIGKTIAIDQAPYTIVGVAQPGARIPEPSSGQIRKFDFVDVQPDTAPQNQRGARYLSGLAVLKPGVSVEGANAELALISDRLQKHYPTADALHVFRVKPLRAVLLGDVSPGLWTIFVAVFGILLITCANVANLVLANSSNRDREFALRASLGASNARIAAQLLIETGLLALAGGTIGVFLAYFTLYAMIGAHLLSLPRIDDVRIDTTVLWFAMLTVVFSTVVAGFWPILTIRRRDLASTLKSAGRGGDAVASNGMRSTLVVAEIAIALALVVLSGLMARSFIELTRTDLGIRPEGIVASDIAGLSGARYKPLSARGAFEQRLLTNVRAIPGVTSAATAISYPLSDITLSFTFGIVGRSFPLGQEPTSLFNSVSSRYFSTLGIPVLRGREFTDADTASSTPVVIINQALAQQLFPQGDALGKQLHTSGFNGSPRAIRTIVGIVGNERHRLGRPPREEHYTPMSQQKPDFVSVVVRAEHANPAAIGRAIQAAYNSADPLLEPPKTYTIDDLVRDNSLQERSGATLLAVLAVVAFVLALSGIFGVMSFAVSRRSREFGVRMALGARSRDVLFDVLLRALVMTGIGVAAGVALALLGARAIASQLYGISPFDPLTFVSVVALIVACAGLAALLPAARATRVDPVVSLRYE